MNSQNGFIVSNFPIRIKNKIQPLICGEAAWKLAYEKMLEAKSNIHLCFWAMDWDFELLRPINLEKASSKAREKYTIYSVLKQKAKEGVKIRILLNNVQQVIRRIAPSYKLDDEDFEIIYQPHPTNEILGSWHQKSIILDDSIAFVSGMNCEKVDWDTTSHLAIDLKRSDFNLSTAERIKINKQKNVVAVYEPRHDYMVYVEGEAVMDINNNFIERWNNCLTNKVIFSSQLKKYKAVGKQTTIKNINSNTNCQITRTFPNLDKQNIIDTEILKVYLNAIANAEKFIYIENQYFRSNDIANALVDAHNKNKELKIIIVTIPDWRNIDFNLPLDSSPRSYFLNSNFATTEFSNEAFEILSKGITNFRFYYLLTSLINNNKREYVGIYLHSKLMIIDDNWCTIGSANINDRSLKLDGELNISYIDSSIKDLRKSILKIHLDVECPDDAIECFEKLENHSILNNKLLKNKSLSSPAGFIFSYSQKDLQKNIKLIPRKFN